MNTLSRCVAVSVLFAAVSGAHAADAAPSVQIRSLPGGGVVDATGKIGYVIGKDGAIEALNLETGKVLWTRSKAQEPLAVLGKKLIALAPERFRTVRIVVLDSAQGGKKVLESDTISFPGWVGTGWDRWFWTFVSFDKNDLICKWRAAEYSTIVRPDRPRPMIRGVKKEAHSALRINLETGKVEVLADDKVPSDSPKLPKALENEKSEGYEIDDETNVKPLSTGNGFAALVLNDKGEKLSLKRWDTKGNAQDTVELLKGKSLLLLSKRISADGRHLIVDNWLFEGRVQNFPKSGQALWVFSLESGKQVAKFPDPNVNEQIAVFGERAFRHSHGTLKAYDLKSGKLMWQHPIESTAAALHRWLHSVRK